MSNIDAQSIKKQNFSIGQNDNKPVESSFKSTLVSGSFGSSDRSRSYSYKPNSNKNNKITFTNMNKYRTMKEQDKSYCCWLFNILPRL